MEKHSGKSRRLVLLLKQPFQLKNGNCSCQVSHVTLSSLNLGILHSVPVTGIKAARAATGSFGSYSNGQEQFPQMIYRSNENNELASQERPPRCSPYSRQK